MSMLFPGLITAHAATAAIAAARIVKHGAADGAALQASGGADALLGISTSVPADAGETVDVYRSGIAPLTYGGNVTRGDPLTADATGRGVLASPGVGATLRIIGFAEVSGVANDIGSVCIAPGIIRGPAT